MENGTAERLCPTVRVEVMSTENGSELFINQQQVSKSLVETRQESQTRSLAVAEIADRTFRLFRYLRCTAYGITINYTPLSGIAMTCMLNSEHSYSIRRKF